MTTERSVAILLDFVYEYQRELLRGMQARLKSQGVRSVVFVGRELHPTETHVQQANEVYRMLHPENHLGVLVVAASLGFRSTDSQLQAFYEGFNLPVVTVSRKTPPHRVVQVDNRPGMVALMQHLLGDCGYRKFVFLRGTEGHEDARVREEVFCEMLQSHGVRPEEQVRLQGEFYGPRTEMELRKLLAQTRDFDTVVAANDEMALVALDTLKAHGLRVPEDVAVVGFDDAVGTAFVDPPLTTVRQPLFQQGWHAADLLMQQVQGSVTPEILLLDTEVVIRESTCMPEQPTEELGAFLTSSHAPLLKMLHEAVAHSEQERFLRELDLHLQNFPSHDEEAQAMHLLELLEAEATRNLTAEQLPQLRAVLFQTRRLLERRQFFRVSRTSFMPDRNTSQLQRLELNLISQTQWDSLKQDLAQYLRWSGIDGVSVVLHSQHAPHQDGPHRLFFSTHPEATEGPSWHDLLPADHLLVLPLFVRSTHLGLLLVDSHQAQQMNVEHLQHLISSGLHHVQFTQQQRRYTLELEKHIDQRETEVAQLSQQMEYLAIHDEVTGLPNKTLFHARLEQVIQRSQQEGQFDYAVLFLDLDRFKKINDTYGHRTGDVFLHALAERLQSSLRPYDLVARFGGDEFAVLLQGVPHLVGVQEVVIRLQRELSQPCWIGGQHIQTTVSVGMVRGDARYTHPEELLRDADIAMYEAKKLGGGQSRLFEVHMHEQVSDRTRLESDLREVLMQRGLGVHYQPILNLCTGRIDGFEALARWIHPQRGFVSPAAFIPVAEESGWIIELDRQVLEAACRQVACWNRSWPEEPGISVSANLSTIQFSRADLLPAIKEILQNTGLPARLLHLEITESLLLQRDSIVLENIRMLQQLGICLHIDDFGTGYSSLGYLQEFQASTLKIDRSFIQRMLQDTKCLELVRTIITMAHNLGMTVVAEGVEEKEQQEWLTEAGCEYLQGYLFSRPLPADQAEALLERTLNAALFQQERVTRGGQG
ncbi:EAL domain-containing protein [Deinococcus cellulosilyticus]|nr:EAL domain-containing protein [Deinococcus cellulosilyticus]